MKIAVASTDGVTVASTLTDARGFLIFEALGNGVGSVGRRKRDGVRWIRGSLPLVHIQESGATISSAARSDGGAGVPDEMLRKMLDCEVVVAGNFHAAEQAGLRRLGILALPALPGEAAAAVVRFVVSGAPPQEGEVCGHCPKRQTVS
ncbi:MAG: hypothetical protein IT169_18755 [Bryobacterales bacterium]|nr:hypothetical protein [Bryobacterales bacterium]